MSIITNKSTHSKKLTKGLIIAAILMMVFGAAEVRTSFSHEFFGLTTTQSTVSTIIGTFIGLCYFASGVLVLTQRKTAAVIAIVLLGIDAVGRIGMVLAGLYPVDSELQTFSIIAGTVIVILFAIYIRFAMKHFK